MSIINFANGYTLLEGLVVLVMIGILSAISVPSLQYYLQVSNDRLLQAQLLRTVELARREAQAGGRPVSLCRDESADRLLVFIDEEDQGIAQDKAAILASTQLNLHRGTLHWRSYPHYRHYLHFMPAWMSADNGMFWYCRTTNTMPVFAVAVNRLGEGHVIYPADQGEIKDSRGRKLSC